MTRSPRSAALAAVAVATFALAVEAAGAATFTFRPVADTYADSATPNTTRGTLTTLKTDGSPVVNTYLRFNVSGLDGPVRRASLRLWSLTSTSTGVGLYPVASNTWGEATLKWSNRPVLGSQVASSGGFSAGARFALDATRLVAGNGLVSMAVKTPSSSSKSFTSREGAAAQVPELVVETEQPPVPPPAGAPLVAAAGDIACDPADSGFNGGLGSATRCHMLATSDLLVSGGYSAVLPLGDLQYSNGTLAKFNASYDPSWGRVKAITRPAPGNHEYQTPGAAGYFDYFNGVGNATGLAGARDRGYYSFDVGSWHVVALNSNCSVVSCATGSAQEQWLRADLAANPRSCTLAYWHHPRFTSDVRGNNTSVGPLFHALYDARADVVLSGHTHHYERFAKQGPTGIAERARGIREFVVGTGGKDFQPLGTVQPNSGVRNGSTYGVLRLRLRTTGYDWTFVPETGAAFGDSGSDECDAATQDSAAPSVPQNLTANPATPNRVELSWTASTDNDGVSAYRILRDGVAIGQSRLASYSDTTAGPSTTYAYSVQALDPAGNESAPSAAQTVTTPSAGTILTFAPTDDAYVRADSPAGNFGSATTLQVDNSPVKHILMKFAVSGLGTRSVASARLRIHAVDPSPSGGQFFATVTSDWTEAGVTWTGAPAAASSTPAATLGAVTAGTWYEVDLTSLVTGDGVVSLKVASTNGDGADYSSAEGTPGLTPELVVTAGP